MHDLTDCACRRDDLRAGALTLAIKSGFGSPTWKLTTSGQSSSTNAAHSSRSKGAPGNSTRERQWRFESPQPLGG
jgi:hypothetical protein